MPPRVLDVGQCPPDHAALRRLLEGLGAEVVQAHALADTLAQLRAGGIDLVLVNRKLDLDYSDGLEIIRRLKAEPALRAVPVMLVSNYPEAQAEAVAAGAEPGFGKAQLDDQETRRRLERFLAPAVSGARPPDGSATRADAWVESRPAR
jgi:two-component system chemotaxis response regulator CheY